MLNYEVSKIEDVEESMRDLYVKKEDKYVL
jgi:hypothetical protein